VRSLLLRSHKTGMLIPTLLKSVHTNAAHSGEVFGSCRHHTDFSTQHVCKVASVHVRTAPEWVKRSTKALKRGQDSACAGDKLTCCAGGGSRSRRLGGGISARSHSGMSPASLHRLPLSGEHVLLPGMSRVESGHCCSGLCKAGCLLPVLSSTPG